MNSLAAVGLYLQPNGKGYYDSSVFLSVLTENTY